ncbi:TPA: hypothetical protein ACH3X2_012872 [Trebouxia sp. C0005]
MPQHYVGMIDEPNHIQMHPWPAATCLTLYAGLIPKGITVRRAVSVIDRSPDALRIKLQEKKEPLEDDACSPEKSAQKRKGISSADEKEEAQARESKRRVIGGASNGSLGKHGKKTTEGSDATALETTVQGQVTERGNTMDAAKAKVSSAAESQELQESSQKDAAKEASKEQLITDK